MSSADLWSSLDRRAGLLIDTNLLVLFIVGSVNPNRIERFKRTSQYTRSDYQLLLSVLDHFEHLYTSAHVMAEVSNLTDLTGRERILARRRLKDMLDILREPWMPSVRAAQSARYESLGLTDASVMALAREHKCAVLTADFDLYLALSRDGIPVLNFAHVQQLSWGV
jgi:predicted nucleic acid-binding protein